MHTLRRNVKLAPVTAVSSSAPVSEQEHPWSASFEVNHSLNRKLLNLILPILVQDMKSVRKWCSVEGRCKNKLKIRAKHRSPTNYYVEQKQMRHSLSFAL